MALSCLSHTLMLIHSSQFLNQTINHIWQHILKHSNNQFMNNTLSTNIWSQPHSNSRVCMRHQPCIIHAIVELPNIYPINSITNILYIWTTYWEYTTCIMECPSCRSSIHIATISTIICRGWCICWRSWSI